jgi:F420-dependent oxidoreductase-like protein
MAAGTIGLQVEGADAATLLSGILRAEELGIGAAWLITAAGLPDGLTVLAAAASRSERILLGTAITPTFPRHPLVTAQQAQAIAALAPGRFRLGVGPGGKGAIERAYGIPFRRPRAHIRTYIKVLKLMLQEGAADVEENGIVAHARAAGPAPNAPVYASALRRRAFELAGEVADGAITWLCPATHVRDVGLPALLAGAANAGRPAPPLVMHVPVCVVDDDAAAREAMRRQFGFYLSLSTYANVFADAGFADAQQSGWTDAMIDATAVFGSAELVQQRLAALLELGVAELLVSLLLAGADPEVTMDRTLHALAELASDPA